ncbi:unnamed protein product [Arabis nemorensis]|uniref:Trichome birefringence-like C-terminal domain-containing protein n=1 Tax=Arabis nemorensis TaxID=586526 RepID=A0A565CDI1_9BRAS|nr:unnamed protein product [Arabis nemorensis]
MCKDFECSIDFTKSLFRVQESDGTHEEKRRHQRSITKLRQNAVIVIFNTGHWWAHQTTYEGFQGGKLSLRKIRSEEAYTKALLHTWADWVDSNTNSMRTRVFFIGFR